MDSLEIQAQTDEFVAYHQDVADVALDYSVASIAHVDALLATLHRQRADPADVGDLVVGVASYVGEVIRRTLGGAWIDDRDAAAGGLIFNPGMRVVSTSIRPVDQVCKCIGNGAEDSLSAWYAALAQGAGERAEPSA
jgi:hypothetical protein